MVMQMPDKDARLVAPDTTMLELFDQSNSSLLVLGEPGSGKTTMLLELCRQTINRAKEDLIQPIPVVLNLSSWKSESKKKPEEALTNWLVNEFNDRYTVPKKVGMSWIERDELLLLLDGLDEVKEENRESCIKSINAFKQEHMIQLAVFSRKHEYYLLEERLKLNSSLIIQPLNGHQVNQYLNNVRRNLIDVYWSLIQQSEHMNCNQEEIGFLSTPLFLSMLVLAFENASSSELETLVLSGNYRKNLFDTYIQQMLKRCKAGHRFVPEKTQAWLSMLAHGMIERGQDIFGIEDIQPEWIPLPEINRYYIALLIIEVIIGSVGALINRVIGQFMWGLGGIIDDSLVYAILTGVGFVFVADYVSGNCNKPADKLAWSWKDFRKEMARHHNMVSILVLVVVFSLGFVICWREGLLNGLFVLLGDTPSTVLAYSLGIGSLLVIFLPFVFIVSGIRRITIDDRNRPGDGITTSLKTMLTISITIFSCFLLMGVLFGVLTGVINFGVKTSLQAGVLFSLLLGWVFGGGYLVRYMISHWLLYLDGNLPKNLINFLDYSTECIFLRRVGGGYIFIHRMLMEYFASMNEGQK
jgi:GTPase SAR1 family protein